MIEREVMLAEAISKLIRSGGMMADVGCRMATATTRHGQTLLALEFEAAHESYTSAVEHTQTTMAQVLNENLEERS